MYRDDSYEVNPNWPPRLLREIAELDSYYDADDELHFDLFAEGFEATVKAMCINHAITKKDLDTVFRRYGWR